MKGKKEINEEDQKEIGERSLKKREERRGRKEGEEEDRVRTRGNFRAEMKRRRQLEELSDE